MSVVSRFIFALLLVFLSGVAAIAQEPSIAGTNFWLGFMQNQDRSLESSTGDVHNRGSGGQRCHSGVLNDKLFEEVLNGALRLMR